MFTLHRARAFQFVTSAAILAVAACTDSVPVAPRANAGHTPQGSSTLTQLGNGRRVIALRDGRPSAATVARIRALGGTVLRSHEDAGLITASGLTEGAAQLLAQSPDVAHVIRDRGVQWIQRDVARVGLVQIGGSAAARPRGAPDDQSGALLFDDQWNMRVIRAPEVWQLTVNHGKGTTVCDLDTGVDPTHVDLAGKVDLDMSTSMVATEPDILDYNGHGTLVSSQIATNGIGMASVAPQATLCQVKVLDRLGMGLLSDAIAGVIYAADARADVIDMSFGEYLSVTDPDFAQIVDDFQRAVSYAHRKGATLVAEAGDGHIDLATDASNFREIPAQLQNVISVGATSAKGSDAFFSLDSLTSYTNTGYPGVDVFAPGGDFLMRDRFTYYIVGACSSQSNPLCAAGDAYFLGIGTALAAAHVAGEAAVIASNSPGRRKSLDRCILRSADDLGLHVPDPIFGFGRIDVLGGIHCRRIT